MAPDILVGSVSSPSPPFGGLREREREAEEESELENGRGGRV